MRKLILALMILTAVTLSCKKEQSYQLDRPESIIWNPVNETYLISNVGSGTILSLQDKFLFNIFNQSKLEAPKGMAILDNVLYVADVTRVVGLDLETGKQVFEQAIPDAVFLNDVAADNEKSIYVSDSRSNFIVRIVPSTGLTEFFRHPDLVSPNGLFVAAQDSVNLLYIVSMEADTPIRILNFFSKEFTAVPNYKLTRADGITRDQEGSWLISSWADSTVYKFSPDWSEQSHLQKTYQSPADIFYSIENNELAIPHMQTDMITFISEDKSTQVENK
ncbi:MAG: hypothetical protein R6V77_00135 [Candidatus Cloacimonadaceae bacterium]